MEVPDEEREGMPGARDFLERFRPVGTPGPAGPAGVPVDRRAGLQEELAPVLAQLVSTERECARIGDAARKRAARVRADAAAQAAALVAEARTQAEAERAEVAARELRQRDRRADDELALARRTADRIRRTASEQTPAASARVVGLVREELGVGGQS
jgi:hypothetical protein